VRVELWTDGSGTRPGHPGGWAFVLRTVDEHGYPLGHKLERSGGMLDATNNRAELTAVLMGLRALARGAAVTVYTDSEYVANAFVYGYVHRWASREWRKVKNDDLWRQLLTEVAAHRVAWRHVKGHSGVELNVRCDQLAGAARKAVVAGTATVADVDFWRHPLFADAALLAS
jgi:ribonuclease HI